LGRSRLYRRLRSGPHGQFVERYAIRLVEERLQIPIEAGRVFRGDAGHGSDLKPATIPN
jgi:hypothetical protein